jgi:transcriptional regulator with XRE-family HTH domain
MKVQVNGSEIRRARDEKNISRQRLCDLANERGFSISRPSIERMEGATSTDFFVQDKVKIVAEILDVDLAMITLIKRESVDSIEAELLTSGRALREILKQTEKLVLDVRVEPGERDLQELIIKTVINWDNQAKRFDEEKSQIDLIKNDFESKNLIKYFASCDIHIYHARTHQIAFFDFDYLWAEDENGHPTTNLGTGRPEFSTKSYATFTNDQTYPAHDFDGVGAQIVDYLILCNSQGVPMIFHQTNPFDFPEGTLERLNDEFQNAE